MSRIRTIKPEFWTSEQVMECSQIARLAFIGMWNFCNDNGVHPASCKTLKAQVFPGDNLTLSEVQAMVDDLIKVRLISEPDMCGFQPIWKIDNWRQWQEIPLPSDWQQRRLIVFERDDHTCRYCGILAEAPHCDHVFPRSRGGSDEIDNLVTACPSCNLQKSDRTPEEWLQ